MPDWIELKIYNIPEDILDNNKYEYMIPEEELGPCTFGVLKEISLTDEGLLFDFDDGIMEHIYQKCSYRKKQEKKVQKVQRTHEEIMSNWFKFKNSEGTSRLWERVESYISLYTDPYYIFGEWRLKEYFNDLEMAKIPPEID